MTAYEKILEALSSSGVEFILIEGMAGIAHGSARFTSDVDVVYRRSPENHARMVSALAPFEPYLRGAPPGLPFRWDTDTIRRGLNFTLTTTIGNLDLLGEVAGGGGFEQLLPASARLRVFGVDCYVLGLEKLIETKRAAGRPKDLEVIAELEALREERDRPGR
jgi:predicted nucleotidyltransferase